MVDTRCRGSGKIDHMEIKGGKDVQFFARA